MPKNQNYHRLSTRSLLSPRNASEDLHDLFDIGLKSKIIKPLELNLFHNENIEKLGSYISSPYFNSATIKLRKDNVATSLAKPIFIKSIRKTEFYMFKTYIIAGGLGGFAMELAIWMSERCCQNLILTTRTKRINDYNKYCIQRLRSIGVRIIVCQKDFLFEEQCMLISLSRTFKHFWDNYHECG